MRTRLIDNADHPDWDPAFHSTETIFAVDGLNLANWVRERSYLRQRSDASYDLVGSKSQSPHHWAFEFAFLCTGDVCRIRRYYLTLSRF
jgi:hypothetical protein